MIEKGGKLRLLKQNIIMKIYVYDMVDFEEKILADLAMNSDDEIVCFRERFTLEQLEKILCQDLFQEKEFHQFNLKSTQNCFLM